MEAWPTNVHLTPQVWPQAAPPCNLCSRDGSLAPGWVLWVGTSLNGAGGQGRVEVGQGVREHCVCLTDDVNQTPKEAWEEGSVAPKHPGVSHSGTPELVL